jgi:hypothetical protein
MTVPTVVADTVVPEQIVKVVTNIARKADNRRPRVGEVVGGMMSLLRDQDLGS